MASRDDIRHSIIRQLGDDPHADRIILPGTAWDIVLQALTSPVAVDGSGELPQDVVRLIIAARRVLDASDWASNDAEKRARFRTLDQASEAFAARVPWEDEPTDDEIAPGDPESIAVPLEAARRSGEKLNAWVSNALSTTPTPQASTGETK